jgi:hypothetical protein
LRSRPFIITFFNLHQKLKCWVHLFIFVGLERCMSQRLVWTQLASFPSCMRFIVISPWVEAYSSWAASICSFNLKILFIADVFVTLLA